MRAHFAAIEPDGPPHRVARRFYPLARDIMIPFEAPLEYSVNGQKYFPWFSFWRSNPLADKRLSLFVSLVDEVYPSGEGRLVPIRVFPESSR